MSSFISKIKNIVLLVLAVFTLSACGTTDVKVETIKRAELNIQLPKPLNLKTVNWKITTEAGITYFSLDEDNFKKFNINVERVQNRLALQQTIIKKQAEYYENIVE